MPMDERRAAGTVRNAGGKVEEGFGRVTGDKKAEVEGIASEAAGAAQELSGQAQDSAADAVRDLPGSLGRRRRTIETQPYAASMIAVGVRWLLGRTHRPLCDWRTC